MQQVTLTIKTISSTDKKKDGSELIGKFGKYFLVRADTEEEGWVSWFSKTAHTHKPGDKITGNLEVKEANGFTNKNFTFPKKTDGVDPEEFRKLTFRVTTLETSFERKFAELKADLVLQLTGKFRTDSDFKKDEENIKQQRLDMGIDIAPDLPGIPLEAYEQDF